MATYRIEVPIVGYVQIEYDDETNEFEDAKDVEQALLAGEIDVVISKSDIQSFDVVLDMYDFRVDDMERMDMPYRLEVTQ